MTASIERLLAGFGRFRQHWFEEHPDRYQELARGQQPHTMVIACCDSRVDPGLLTDSPPGEIFVVRNVANLVPPCVADGRHHGTSAALEFAVRALKVENVLVLGHSQCGGIRALVEGSGSDFMFIQPWMEIARAACLLALQKDGNGDAEARLRRSEQAGIAQSLANLATFPWIREAIGQGRLQLHGWHFDLGAGVLSGYHPATDSFRPLVAGSGAGGRPTRPQPGGPPGR